MMTHSGGDGTAADATAADLATWAWPRLPIRRTSPCSAAGGDFSKARYLKAGGAFEPAEIGCLQPITVSLVNVGPFLHPLGRQDTHRSASVAQVDAEAGARAACPAPHCFCVALTFCREELVLRRIHALREVQGFL